MGHNPNPVANELISAIGKAANAIREMTKEEREKLRELLRDYSHDVSSEGEYRWESNMAWRLSQGICESDAGRLGPA